MDIDQQIQALIDNAPNDGRTPNAIEAIAPALKLIAAQLKHPQYYILQNLEQQWVMTTFNHPTQPELTKNVIQAFPTLKDAGSGPNLLKDPQIMAIPVPVVHILFQMMAMKTIDSIVFFEIAGNPRSTAEISRQNFHDLIQNYLQKMQTPPPPSDIA
ncbi:MAG TPA: hypothetical protein V6C88_07790 [Chroococcidiopsis sp.]